MTQQAALQHLGRDSVGFAAWRPSRGGAAQHRLHPLDQQALRERLPDEVVGAHLEAEQFVDLLVLGGEEDHRHVGLLAQAAQQLHAVHARHLDVEDGEVGRVLRQPVERRGAVGIGRPGSPRLPARWRPRSGCCGRRRPERSSA
jgi:hypothetical protein